MYKHKLYIIQLGANCAYKHTDVRAKEKMHFVWLTFYYYIFQAKERKNIQTNGNMR